MVHFVHPGHLALVEWNDLFDSLSIHVLLDGIVIVVAPMESECYPGRVSQRS